MSISINSLCGVAIAKESVCGAPIIKGFSMWDGQYKLILGIHIESIGTHREIMGKP